MSEKVCEAKIEAGVFDKVLNYLMYDNNDSDAVWDSFVGNICSCVFSDGFKAVLTVEYDNIGFWDVLRLYDPNGYVVCEEPPEYDLCDREIEYNDTVYKIKIKTFGNNA